MRWFFAACDAVTAILVLIGVFEGLPTRWLPVDLAGGVVVASLAAAAFFSVKNRARFMRLACGVVLAIGLAVFALLAISASHLAGIYGPIGKGSALILLLVAALVIPYLIALPAAQIVWSRQK